MRASAIYTFCTLLSISAVAGAGAQTCPSEPSIAAMQRKQAAAAQFTADSLDAALKKAGLVKVELPTTVVTQRYEPPGSVIKGADGSDYLVAGHIESPSEHFTPLLLVEDAGHALYIADLDPQMRKRTFRACGCGEAGGGAFMPQTFGYKLSRLVKGHLKVTYAAKEIEIRWTNLQADGSPCEQKP
jgi:hypothetical protein